MNAEKMWQEYDMYFHDACRKAQSIVNNKFVETFNDIFYCEVDKYGIPNEFSPRDGFARGNIKKTWLKDHIWNLIYDLHQYGFYVGVEKINGKWENIVDVDRHFVRTDKYYGVFLLDYKFEQMFDSEDLRFKHYRKLTRLRIKLNTPNSEWIKVI